MLEHDVVQLKKGDARNHARLTRFASILKHNDENALARGRRRRYQHEIRPVPLSRHADTASVF